MNWVTAIAQDTTNCKAMAYNKDVLILFRLSDLHLQIPLEWLDPIVKLPISFGVLYGMDKSFILESTPETLVPAKTTSVVTCG
jgi:hypothetical protein